MHTLRTPDPKDNILGLKNVQKRFLKVIALSKTKRLRKIDLCSLMFGNTIDDVSEKKQFQTQTNAYLTVYLTDQSRASGLIFRTILRNPRF